MTYRDPDSGLEFASYDEYERVRGGFYNQQPTDDEMCAADGHRYAGDDGDVGRCFCGAQVYPFGGGEHHSRGEGT